MASIHNNQVHLMIPSSKKKKTAKVVYEQEKVTL